MRNSDYVGLKGFRKSIKLHDEILTEARYEVAKVQTNNPLLNWVLDDRSQNTVAYQILVSSNESDLNKNKGDYWDSGKTFSNRSSAIYDGNPLSKNKVYYWKVR